MAAHVGNTLSRCRDLEKHGACGEEVRERRRERGGGREEEGERREVCRGEGREMGGEREGVEEDSGEWRSLAHNPHHKNTTVCNS